MSVAPPIFYPLLIVAMAFSLAAGQGRAGEMPDRVPSTSDAAVWCTYLGGRSQEYGAAMAADADGNIWLTGHTRSADFPTTNGPSRRLRGDVDAFVAKFSPDGRLLLSTYLGGGQWDGAYGLAVDDAGNILVTGRTMSPDFPMAKAEKTGPNPAGSTFVTKMDRRGNVLWSRLIGAEYGYCVAADGAGNIFVAGRVGWRDFPTPGGYDTTYNGGAADVFVAKFRADGELVWATFLGGQNGDIAYDIAADATGNVYVAGSTESNDFPTSRAFDSTFSGGPREGDAFVAKFTTDGALIWSTYLGGSGRDYASGLALDREGNVYVSGSTGSDDFPAPGGYQPVFQGGLDAFLAKFTSDGALLWSTFIGGGDMDCGHRVAVSAAGDVFLSGDTASPNFPLRANVGRPLPPGGAVFAAQFSADGALLGSWTIGGSAHEEGRDIAVDGAGNVYVTGPTWSSDLPTVNAFDPTFNGEQDVFVARLRAGKGG